VALLIVVLLAIMVMKRSGQDDDKPRARPVQAQRGDAGPGAVRRPARRGVRNRMAGARAGGTGAGGGDSDAEEDHVETEREQIIREAYTDANKELPEGKIGTKKLRKLEEKAEKRRNREIEVQEREEKKKKQAEEDEKRKKEEDKLEEEEKKKEDEEKRLREEKERQEYEEYLKIKQSFDVEEEGYDQDDDPSSQGSKLREFIGYIQEQKVVLLEDLASKFKLKTQDCIERIQTLLDEELLCGVIDDRGKFISITLGEFEEVAKFIKQRGRVSIQELVENSNRLINIGTVGA